MAPHRRRILSAEADCGYGADDSCSPPSPRPTVVGLAPPPVPLPPSTPIQISNKNHVVTLVVVVVASVLAVCFLLLTYYAVLRFRSSRRRRFTAMAAAGDPPQPPFDLGDDLREDLLVAGGGQEPYHVWYIRTVGLDEGTIGAITVCTYRKGEGLVEGTDCAICLGEFGEGELLRLLPKCSHAFHLPCVDTWLRSHVNCPLCRAPILAPHRPLHTPPTAAAGGGNAAAATAAGGEVAVAVDGSSVTDPPEIDPGGSENTLLQTASEGGSEDDRNSAVSQVVVDHSSARSSFSSDGSEIWVPIDLGNGVGDDTASNAPPEEGDGDGKLQPVRRSMSMDSSAVAGLLLKMRLAGNSRDGGKKPRAGEDPSAIKKGGIVQNNCKELALLDAPPEIERSMSGGRFFLSGFSGRARSVILPL